VIVRHVEDAPESGHGSSRRLELLVEDKGDAGQEGERLIPVTRAEELLLVEGDELLEAARAFEEPREGSLRGKVVRVEGEDLVVLPDGILVAPELSLEKLGRAKEPGNLLPGVRCRR
jgi:hypothetical protein